MEEKKNKSNKIIIVILIILLLATIGVCIYLLVDKFSETKNEYKINNNENANENLKNNMLNTLAKSLVEPFILGPCGSLSSIFKGDLVNFYNMEDNPKYYAVLEQSHGVLLDIGHDFIEYNKNMINEKFNKLYGYDKQINLKRVSIDDVGYSDLGTRAGTSMLYFVIDGENESYISTTTSGCGSGVFWRVYYKIIDVKQKNNDLEIYLKVMEQNGTVNLVSSTLTTMTNKLFGKYHEYNEEPITSFESEKYEEAKNLNLDELYEKYEDKLTTFKFIFKYDSEHDNYYFYSVESVK